MKLTNKLHVPAPIYDAVANQNYTRGDVDISVTQLLDPPRLVTLFEQYQEELEEDVSDRLYAILGTSFHSSVEQPEYAQQEVRLYTEVLGWRVSGQYDYMDENGVIWDWKSAFVREIDKGVKSSREQQLNLYGHLATLNGQEVRGLRVGFILRDWSKISAATVPGYPPHQFMEYPIPLWDYTTRQAYLEERVRIHQAARQSLPQCSDDDRWATPDKYAVIKQGNKRATKLYTTLSDAAMAANQLGASYAVEVRPGESIRCKYYCPVSSKCEQWKSIKTTT